MYIADLHIHSRYSRATSRDCDLPHLDFQARRKGIQLLGTGDFTHPKWRQELQEQLEPAEEGFYRLKDAYRLPDNLITVEESPRFVLSGEISSIYKKNGKVRKVHNVILMPGLEQAEQLSRKLEAIGNIHSDGRPILGLDSRDLLEIALEVCPDVIFIPAHIWTPHFSLFGAFSGFDSIEECFEDLTPYIHGLETGLSSDPIMNRRVSALDRYTLISNSDAHSPVKLGREANLLDGPLSYPSLAKAIETGEGFYGTLEFFPEEGKYHLDGHRNCQLCLTPAETMALEGRCPVCGKKITVGVQHRVEDLADRPEESFVFQGKPFSYMVPLPEVIGASTGTSAAGVKVQRLYETLIEKLGPEFQILRQTSPADIERVAGPCVAEGIRRLRNGQAERIPGYDGAYGKITLLAPWEIQSLSGQLSMLGDPERPPKEKKKAPVKTKIIQHAEPDDAGDTRDRLNPEQQKAVTSAAPVTAVIAGPGTGKTKTLVARIAYLIEEQGVKPSQITAVTFTNQAAAEMRQRLEQRLGGKKGIRGMTIGTFHGLCYRILGAPSLLGEAEAAEIAEQILAAHHLKMKPREFLQAVSNRKNGLDSASPEETVFQAYCDHLREHNVCDFDDLLLNALEADPPSGKPFSYLLVDEFQDINPLQYRLILHWGHDSKSLFVIGDPDQSIYGFRGADSHCFEHVQRDWPELEEIRLITNYRSTPEILSCALPVISRNPGADRTLLPNRPENGLRVRQITTDSEYSEGIFIAKEIGRMTGGTDMLEAQAIPDRQAAEIRAFSDVAILCRTNRQMQVIEKCLRHDSIPCIISGKEDYLDEPEIRGTLGFFRHLLNIRDTASLETALKLIWKCSPEEARQAAGFCGRLESWDCNLLLEQMGASPAFQSWITSVESFLPRTGREKPRKLLEDWCAGKSLSTPMEKLLNMAVLYDDMPSFLNNLLLGEECDFRRAAGKGKTYASGAVRLMTMHASKGLEFPVVFLAGVRADMIPLHRPGIKTDEQEERRLFYVGMTRAREELLLLTSADPSPFLEDMPKNRPALYSAESFIRPPEVQQLRLF